MKKETKTFLWRTFDFSVLLFLLDLAFGIISRSNFPLFPSPEFFGTIFTYILVGSIVAGIPLVLNLKRKKLIRGFKCQEHQ